ncbi:MAG: hypothetical protein NZ483_05315 [Verrucomicrobiae bacterium]|nr:hypothetical protein [Verrucomicrobiae bacterium]
MSGTKFVPGLTLRSLAVGLLAVMLMAMHIQFVEVILADPSAVAEHALPIPAMAVFFGLWLVVVGLRALTRRELLNRAELFCVLMILLMAAPLMSQGMWHRFLGLLAATPRSENFHYLDAFNDKLWPHGPNLFADRFESAATRGQATWTEAALDDRRTVRAVQLRNNQLGDVSSVDIAVPVTTDSHRGLVPGEPYLVSVLARGENFAPQTRIFIRATDPTGKGFTELLTSAEEQRVTFVHPRGFQRLALYGVKLFAPAEAEHVTISFGLSGPGTVVLADPKLFSVAALEWAYSGRVEVSAEEAARLAPHERAGVLVRPARWLSWEGLCYVVTAYIPVRAWITPAVAWSSLVLLLLAATFAIAVLMRRLWAEHQRYLFPTFQIPALWLAGSGDEPSIWRRRALWVGFGLALVWCLMRGWQFYNANVPNLNVAVNLGDYLSDPGWGGMWQITFSLSAIFLSLCLFMELNVLLSLVVGYLAYRALFWIGSRTGWDAMTGYPFPFEQAIGAYLGYTAIVVILSWRYWRELGVALRQGRWPERTVEALSPRVAVGLLVSSFVGVYLLARWLEAPAQPLLIYFGFLVTIGFVAAKLRAECGLPWGYFAPYNAMLFVGLLGGMLTFGPAAMLICLIASGFLTVAVFFYLPGLQVELVEFGRRWNVKPRHLVLTALLGALAGLLAGGWVFLTNAYALGGDSIKYQWAFQQDWFFYSYRHELTRATAAMLGQGTATASGWQPSTWAYVFGGAGTVILTIIRQMAPGFWFHPIGFILGSSHFASAIWGSALLAWIIKWICLKLGGAQFYRQKLVPFAVGVFLAAVVSVLFFNVLAIYLRATGIENTYGGMP